MCFHGLESSLTCNSRGLRGVHDGNCATNCTLSARRYTRCLDSHLSSSLAVYVVFCRVRCSLVAVAIVCFAMYPSVMI